MTNDKLAVAHDFDLEIRRRGNWDRREFVKGVAALAGSAGLLGYDMKPSSAEPPPEITTIRLTAFPGGVFRTAVRGRVASQGEGFTDVSYSS